MALFAIAHDQIFKALPFEPPTQMVWYKGKQSSQFNKQKGADALAKFF
jgi:hypothetical protein